MLTAACHLSHLLINQTALRLKNNSNYGFTDILVEDILFPFQGQMVQLIYSFLRVNEIHAANTFSLFELNQMHSTLNSPNQSFCAS